jgi:hypothetical protein
METALARGWGLKERQSRHSRCALSSTESLCRNKEAKPWAGLDFPPGDETAFLTNEVTQKQTILLQQTVDIENAVHFRSDLDPIAQPTSHLA